MEYRCVYCQGIIPNVRIRCNVCTDYELCLECFACGAESGNHRSDHDYEPLDDGFHPLFTSCDSSDWSAQQELALIEGIEQYGLGDWESVSCKVRNKTALEVRSHFMQHYVSGSIGQLTRAKTRKYKVMDHTGPESGPLSPSLTVPLPPLNLTRAEAMELGFLPLRDDFEREYDNEAETILSGAMVHHTDEDVDMAYKLSLVSMYRLRLSGRNLRKRVARDYNLVNVYTSSFKRGQPGAKKKGARDYKDFQEKMRRFTKFISLDEHDRFFQSLQKEKQLKSRIKELMRYRRNGITELSDAEKFDRVSSKRERTKDQLKKEKQLPSSDKSVGGVKLNGHIFLNTQSSDSPDLGLTRRSHTITAPSATAPGGELQNSPAATAPQPITDEDMDVSPHTPILRATPERKTKMNSIKTEPVKDVLTEKTLPQLSMLTRKSDTPTSHHHHKDMLSETERKLCRRIGMKTSSYLTLKTCILKDYLKRQHGTPVKLRFPSGFDMTHRRTILNFLEHSGWLQLEH